MPEAFVLARLKRSVSSLESGNDWYIVVAITDWSRSPPPRNRFTIGTLDILEHEMHLQTFLAHLLAQLF